MKKGNVLILAIAATALLGGSAWLYAKKTGGMRKKRRPCGSVSCYTAGMTRSSALSGIPWSRRRRNMKRRPGSA